MPRSPRSPRADEGGGLYHALNRGNLRADIFEKEADFAAFERILGEALEIHRQSDPEAAHEFTHTFREPR